MNRALAGYYASGATEEVVKALVEIAIKYDEMRRDPFIYGYLEAKRQGYFANPASTSNSSETQDLK